MKMTIEEAIAIQLEIDMVEMGVLSPNIKGWSEHIDKTLNENYSQIEKPEITVFFTPWR